MSEKKRQFAAEAEELITEAETRLLDLSEKDDPESLNALFRAIHTLKGNSGIYGLSDIETIAHKLEELLDALRLGRVSITQNVFNTIQKGLDLLKKTLADSASEREISGLIDDIERTLKVETTEKEQDLSACIPENILNVLSEYEEHRLKENLKKGAFVYLKKVAFGLDEFEDKLKETLEALKKDAEVLSTLPEPDGMKDGLISFQILFATTKELTDTSDCEIIFKPERPKASVPTTIKSQSETVKIPTTKIDELVEQTEAVRLIAEELDVLWTRFRDLYGYKEEVFSFYKLAQELKRRASVLQDTSLSLRMVPVMDLFERLAQVARRYARQMDKKINVSIEGAETEMDKIVMEEIADPLMHIVRNSVDHGIESPSERTSAGKSETGSIYFRAKRRGAFAVIEIEDDGRGLDIETLKNKAIEKGLIGTDEKLSREEILSFIFMPGFSTKKEVTELSGRGVGMDVVKSSVERLGGYVDVISETGKFTRVVISVPVTLSLTRVVIVRVSDQYYGIPLENISVTKQTEDAIKWIEGKRFLDINDQVIPALSLGERFSEQYSGTETDAVVVRSRRGERALLVDSIEGTERVLIRPLSGYLRGVRLFSGAFESRGRLCLLIDPEAINN